MQSNTTIPLHIRQKPNNEAINLIFIWLKPKFYICFIKKIK